jgi:hypothetical protein
MKARLLKKLRKVNVIYKRNNEYKYICHVECVGDVWYINTGWCSDLNTLIERRRKQILKMARTEQKTVKSIVR